MKTYLTYGSAMAGGGFLLILVLYILGFHSDPAKLDTAQWVGGCGSLGIAITCIVLGTKARRAQVPSTEGFGYGSALGTGVLIALFASLLGLATTFLYNGVINPHFTEVMMQAQANKMEAKGLSADQIEKIQGMSAMFMKLPVLMVSGFLFNMFFGTVISLISAAFLKRDDREEPSVAG